MNNVAIVYWYGAYGVIRAWYTAYKSGVQTEHVDGRTSAKYSTLISMLIS